MNNFNKIRNIAIIAHVDHGKTTLVDALLKQTHVFRENQEEMAAERLMDTNDLEKERGITIMAKNCAITYQDTKINIIDTPGHADFSGEVERTLGMADGALLIIDAQEGPMPQTRFVLKLALSLGLKVIVIINKIDKRFANPERVIQKLDDLFLELATDESQLNFPTLYAIARFGRVFNELPENLETPGTVEPLLQAIQTYIPSPNVEPQKPFKLLISSLDYDDHLGRIIIGKIHSGSLALGQKIAAVGSPKVYPVTKIMGYLGMERVDVNEAEAGDIIALAGIQEVKIADTLALPGDNEALATPDVSEPTLHLTVGPNTSPFAGKEGKFTTGRQLGDRLRREMENNVGLRLELLDNGKFKVSGRGELHLSILLETMRREGYEMEVGKPEVITKKIDGIVKEPVEELSVLVPNDYVGTINQELGKRQAVLIKMDPVNDVETEFLYRLPTRATLGLRSLLLTLTKGTVILNSQIVGFEPLNNPLPKLRKGALIAAYSGKALEYGLRTLKGRGVSFIQPGLQVYEGMIVGINAKDEDIEINVCKEKNLTNHRSKSHQGITQLAPDFILSLEQSLDFLEPDELLEITPESLRLRKKYLTVLERIRLTSPQVRGLTPKGA